MSNLKYYFNRVMEYYFTFLKYCFYLPLTIIWVSSWVFLLLSLIAYIIVTIGVFDGSPNYRVLCIISFIIATPIVIWSFLND